MDRSWLFGIEIGGTKLQVGLGDRDGSLVDLERRRVDPTQAAAGIRAQIEEAAATVLARRHVLPRQLAAVGIGFGGPVVADQGIVLMSNQIPGWDSFPLAAWVRARLGVGLVVLANDADTAALGESRFGAGVGFDPVLYLTIGSGVGGGLIVRGSIYGGSGRGAIEIGHLRVAGDDTDREGDPSSTQTLESVAAGWSIARAGQRLVEEAAGTPWSPLGQLCAGDAARVTAEMVVQAAVAGDPDALRILRRAQVAVGQGLAHAITLLAPQRVILGGGVSLIGAALWFEPIRREVACRVFPPFRDSYDIVPAGLGEAVVVHGALALAADAADRAGLDSR